MPTLRLGLIEELATLPLVFPLLAGWSDIEGGVQVAPRAVAAERAAEMLDEGELDIAMIPAVDYPLRARQLMLVPIGLSSEKRGPATLVGLDRIDLLDGQRIAVEDRANPAMPLLKVLLRDYYGGLELHFRAEYVGWEELPQQEEREADDWEKMRLTLLLGDEAVAASYNMLPAEKMVAEDLSKNWWIMTGNAFTWYVLAIRQEIAETYPDLGLNLVKLSLDALRKGKEQRPTVLAAGQQRAQAVDLALDDEQLAAFWDEQTFGIIPKQQEVLMNFYLRASRLRLLPVPQSLNMVS